MAMTLLLGGARSGKSRTAERLATDSGLPVVFLATGEAGDEEMADRIARHRANRPEGWVTVEAPRDVLAALEGLDRERFVILDCLTLWLSNMLGDDDQQILHTARQLADRLATGFAASAVVSNEVGSGIVPVDPGTRRYRDLLGMINTIFRDRADQSWLCVAGGVIPIRDVPP